MPKEPRSKEGTVGKNMPAALKGETPGVISPNFKGRPGNADPNFQTISGKNPNAQPPVPVDDWTKQSLKESREKAKERRDAEKGNNR